MVDRELLGALCCPWSSCRAQTRPTPATLHKIALLRLSARTNSRKLQPDVTNASFAESRKQKWENDREMVLVAKEVQTKRPRSVIPTTACFTRFARFAKSTNDV